MGARLARRKAREDLSYLISQAHCRAICETGIRPEVRTLSDCLAYAWDLMNLESWTLTSLRLISASYKTVIVWDLATREQVQTLNHEVAVIAAKYSPQGDPIATSRSINPWFNRGLLWFNAHLFVLSESRIKRFNVSTGSAAAEWPVPDSDTYSDIALSKCGESIAQP